MRNGRPVLLNAILNDGGIGWITLAVAISSTTCPGRTKHCINNRAVYRSPGQLLLGLESNRDATCSKKNESDGKGKNLEALVRGGGRRRRWGAAERAFDRVVLYAIVSTATTTGVLLSVVLYGATTGGSSSSFICVISAIVCHGLRHTTVYSMKQNVLSKMMGVD